MEEPEKATTLFPGMKRGKVQSYTCDAGWLDCFHSAFTVIDAMISDEAAFFFIYFVLLEYSVFTDLYIPYTSYTCIYTHIYECIQLNVFAITYVNSSHKHA